MAAFGELANVAGAGILIKAVVVEDDAGADVVVACVEVSVAVGRGVVNMVSVLMTGLKLSSLSFSVCVHRSCSNVFRPKLDLSLVLLSSSWSLNLAITFSAKVSIKFSDGLKASAESVSVLVAFDS